MRRVTGTWIVVVALVFGLAALDGWAGPGCGGQGMCRRDGGGGPPTQAGGGAGGGASQGSSMADARDTFHALLAEHEKINRVVEEIEGGVATTTISADPAVTRKIREHVRQMQGRVERGEGLRHWDPLFVEIFEHHDEIAMAIDDVPGGVRVRETSRNADVVKLIRAHAKAVTEFTERGFDRAHEATALPEGYPSATGSAERGAPRPR